MNMIERLEDALKEADMQWHMRRHPEISREDVEFMVAELDDSYECLARAAIEAMREPTNAMLFHGGNEEFVEPSTGNEEMIGYWRAKACWPSMIDAALQEGKEDGE